MRNVTVAAIQMQCAKDVETNIQTAERLVRQAAEQGAQIILLPELFERPYFCQERQYDYYQYAQSVLENTAIQHFKEIAKELKVVLPISFYEKDGNVLYNSIAVIDADGEVLGVYRKTHIPDDHLIIRKNSFSHLETQASRSGTLAMPRLESESVGINGSLKLPVVLL